MTHCSVILLALLFVFKCMASALHTETGAPLRGHRNLPGEQGVTVHAPQKSQVHRKALTSCCMLSEAGRATA